MRNTNGTIATEFQNGVDNWRESGGNVSLSLTIVRRSSRRFVHHDFPSPLFPSPTLFLLLRLACPFQSRSLSFLRPSIRFLYIFFLKT